MSRPAPGGTAARRPRVLRVITRLVVSGPATHVAIADRGLRARGWETLLVHGTVEPDEAEVELDELGVPHRRIASMRRAIRPLADLRTVIALARLMRRFDPDIVHTHQSKAGLLGRMAAMLAVPRARRVHTFHGNIFEGYFGSTASRAIVRAERFLGHRTHRVVALSDLQRSELLASRIVPAERLVVVPLGLELDRFRGLDPIAARRSLGLDETAPIVVWIGRLAPIKRVDRLIDAFARVVAGTPGLAGARLYIVGDGALRPDLEARAGAAGVTDRVVFAGWSGQSPTWYAAADLVVLTSDREGTPLSLIEAAAAGRAVVATDVGGIRDVVDDGITGFVVEPDDVAGLAARIEALLDDPERRRVMGTAAAAAVTRFDAERLVDDLDRTYRELLTGWA